MAYTVLKHKNRISRAQHRPRYKESILRSPLIHYRTGRMREGHFVPRSGKLATPCVCFAIPTWKLTNGCL